MSFGKNEHVFYECSEFIYLLKLTVCSFITQWNSEDDDESARTTKYSLYSTHSRLAIFCVCVFFWYGQFERLDRVVAIHD